MRGLRDTRNRLIRRRLIELSTVNVTEQCFTIRREGRKGEVGLKRRIVPSLVGSQVDAKLVEQRSTLFLKF